MNWSQTLRNLILFTRIIQDNQDNDPKHKSYLSTSWLPYNCTKVINTPAQSPAINTVENLWVHVKKEVRKKSPTNKNEWKRFIKEDWKKYHQNITYSIHEKASASATLMLKVDTQYITCIHNWPLQLFSQDYWPCFSQNISTINLKNLHKS